MRIFGVWYKLCLQCNLTDRFFCQLNPHNLQIRQLKKRLTHLFRSKWFSFVFLSHTVHVEDELLRTYTKVYKFDVLLMIVRLAVLTAVTLTVPVVLFPVSVKDLQLRFIFLVVFFFLVIHEG